MPVLRGYAGNSYAAGRPYSLRKPILRMLGPRSSEMDILETCPDVIFSS